MKLNEISELSLPGRAARAAVGPGPRSGWLELFLPPRWPEQGGEIAWRHRAGGGAARHGRIGDLKDLPASARAARVQVWTPAAETVLLRATLPTRSASRIRKALPFALEDQLLEPPENLHFSHVANDDGSLAVAVTARRRLEAWVAALQAAGLRPEGVAPAALSVPLVPGAWTVGYTGVETVLRTAAHSGQGGPLERKPPGWLAVAVDAARRDARTPAKLVVHDAPDGVDLAEWGRILGLEVVDAAAERASLALPCALSLLAGDYAPSGRWREMLRPYRPAAAMLGAWLVIAGIAGAVEWWTLSRAHAAQREEMRALFLQSFPDTQTVLDPARQMQRGVDLLSARKGSAVARDDLLGLLAAAAPALRAEPRAKLKGAAYADRVLTLTVALPDDAAASALADALRAARLEADTADVRRLAAGVEAQIKLRAAAAAARRAP
jgi:general secretion pathway protein L